jgi:cystathionine beta-synthase
MRIKNSILETVGRTPLIKLNRITEGIEASVYVKAEFLNPGGSVKDRIALKMIEAAEREGKLGPGGTIIEATAGNTGAGLALIAAVKGYRCIFVMPDKMSADKVNFLKAYGAEIIITPTSVAPDSPESYNGVADRLAKEIPGSFRPNQFENLNNPLAHYLTTGPEIWEDTGGKVDVFVAGMGTGGTISGTSKYLKEKNPGLIVVGADPQGSILSGDAPAGYKVEGIGEDFIPKTFNRQIVDEMIRITDKESFNTARRLAREEGLLAGGSAGTAVAAALKFAQRSNGPKNIVVLLPDTGRNYINRIFSDEWMQENGFWEERREERTTVGDVLAGKKDFPSLLFLSPQDRLIKAISIFREFDISQVPVLEGKKAVGSLNEVSLMRFLHNGSDAESKVSSVMGSPLPVMAERTDVSEAYRVLLSGAAAIVVEREGDVVGLITRSDLVDYWSKRKEGQNEI